MANIYLRHPDCIFINIPKTGGKSIQKLWGDRYAISKGHIPSNWPPSIFKFAFVRHPLDRLVSAFKMFNYGVQKFNTDGSLFNERVPILAHEHTIDHFVIRVLNDDDILTARYSIRTHTIPMTHPFNCIDQADFVGRYENLDEDFKAIAAHLHIDKDKQIPKVNISKNKEEWRKIMDNLSPDLYEKILEYYADDFSTFKYHV